MAKLNTLINNNHFLSYISLALKNQLIEKEYQKSKYDKLHKMALVFAIFSLVVQIAIIVAVNLWINSLSNITNTEKTQKNLIEKEVIMSYMIGSIAMVNLLFCVFARIANMCIKGSNLLNYFTLCLITNNILAYVAFQSSIPSKEAFLKIDVIFKIIFVFMIEPDYIMIGLSSILAYVEFLLDGLYISHIQEQELYGNAIIILLTIVFCAYIVEKIYKVIFYYKFKNYKKSEWLKSILDSFQSGLIVADMDHVLYFNDYVEKHLKFLIEKRQLTSMKSQIFSSAVSSPAQDITVEINNEPKQPSMDYSRKFSLKRNMTLKYTHTAKWSSRKKPIESVSDTTFNRGINESLAQTNSMMNLNIFQSQADINKDSSDLILNHSLFEDMESLNPEIDPEVIECIRNPDSSISTVLQMIEHANITGKHFQEFILIGNKKFFFQDNPIEDDKLVILEIYVRIVEKNGNGVAFEFLFHDVTRSKLIEESKAQIKFKTLFLAKVAHEFKNPLIMIKELSDQIGENVGVIKNTQKEVVCDSSSYFKEKLTLLQNLSNYMLILVKDFEVMSKKDCKTKIDLLKESFDIREELVTIKQIVEALIYKKHGKIRESPVQFNLTIVNRVPLTIATDKTRLNQILINLLSNSVKFTQVGTISLVLSLESPSRVKFQVVDTGKGINENEEKMLFKDFSKGEMMNNAYGSGLGLSIVKELCSLMGSEIRYERNRPNGSIFSFSMPLDNQIKEQPKEMVINHPSSMKSNPICPVHCESNLCILPSSAPRFIKKIRRYLSCENFERNREHTKFLGLTFHSRSAKDNIFSSELADNRSEYRKLSLPFDSNCKSPCSIMEKKSSFSSFTQMTSCFNQKTKIYNMPMVLNRRFEKEDHSSSNFPYCDLFISCAESFQIYSQIDESKTMVTINFNKIMKSFYHPSIQKVGNLKKNLEKDPSQRALLIIVTDDDALVRSSLIRVLERFVESLKKRVDLTIIETSDGIECLYAVYNSIHQKMQVDLIISDETMNYMSGSFLLEVLSRMTSSNVLPYSIPVSIVSAYEEHRDMNPKYNHPNLCGVFQKPVNRSTFEQMFSKAHLSL